MRPLLLSISLLLIISGCEQTVKVDNKQAYPKAQIDLMTVLNNTDSIITAENNELGVQAAMDSGNARIQKLIKKDLALKIDRWIAYVDNVSEALLGGPDEFEVNAFIPLGNKFDPKNPTLHSIKLSCRFKKDAADINAVAKNLKKLDKVMISGDFIIDTTGDITLTSIGGVSDKLDYYGPTMNMSLTHISKL